MSVGKVTEHRRYKMSEGRRHPAGKIYQPFRYDIRQGEENATHFGKDSKTFRYCIRRDKIHNALRKGSSGLPVYVDRQR